MNDIEKDELHRLVLEFLVNSPSAQFGSVLDWVSVKMGQAKDQRARQKLKKAIDKILWDLVIERYASFGSEDGGAEARYPFICLTELGRRLATETEPHFYDPERYAGFIVKIAPGTDDVIKQYAFEAVRCYQHSLIFAAAVMIGAAAERSTLNLLGSVAAWEPDNAKKAKGSDLLKRGKLPQLFEYVRDGVERAGKTFGMPYSVHEGALSHLLSFQDMVRVQRNDAVHPAAGTVSKDSVFLALQTFPHAQSVVQRLREWFLANSHSGSRP